MKILAIETSCDETACAIVEDGRKVLSNIISSQIDIHTLYGGVVPEIASRNHILKIDEVVVQALDSANIKLDEIDAISVTVAPGLIGALLVGVSYAKGLAYSLNKPLIPVHHIEGHIAANYLEYPELEPPFLCMVVSGGHSHIVWVKDYDKFKIIGRTQDDACGEAFDKVARVLGLGYPGGPKLEKLAEEGNKDAIHFPRAKVSAGEYDYSFSGIKSSVLNYINMAEMKGEKINKADIAASFQHAVTEMLVTNLIKAAENMNINKIAIAGGVSANNYITNYLRNEADKRGYMFYCPSKIYCTDNAAMIGSSAYYNYIKNKEIADLSLNAVAHIDIGNHEFV